MYTQEERNIVIQGRKQGKSDDFIKQAVIRYRERQGEPKKTSFMDKAKNFAMGFNTFVKEGKIVDVLGGEAVTDTFASEIAKIGRTQEEKDMISASQPTLGQTAGSALSLGSLFAPVGTAAKALTTGARALGITKGASAIGKIGTGLALGETVDVAQNLQEGKTGAEAFTPGIGTALGGAIPTAGVAKNVVARFGNRQAPRIINSLIKPLAKDFSYGKNPGRAIAEEGIVANNFDDLITKIRTTRQKIGQEIGTLGDTLSSKPELNIRNSLSPLDEAMKNAAAQNNATLGSRIQNVKRAIIEKLEPSVDDAGNFTIKSTGQRNLEKLTFQEVRDILGEIGDMTQFTGNPSDDKLVNSALKQIYGNIKQVSLQSAEKTNPELAKQFRKLTEKYADLSSAEIAAKYRDKIVERSALIGMSPQVSGIGAGIITAVASGGAAIPAILAGASVSVLQKLAQTPAFKTRLAAILSKMTTKEVSNIATKVPALKTIFPEIGKLTTPGDMFMQTNTGNKLSAGLMNYLKDPKLGASVKRLKITPDDVKILQQISSALKEQATVKVGKGATVPIPSGVKAETEQAILANFGIPVDGKSIGSIAKKIDEMLAKINKK